LLKLVGLVCGVRLRFCFQCCLDVAFYDDFRTEKNDYFSSESCGWHSSASPLLFSKSVVVVISSDSLGRGPDLILLRSSSADFDLWSVVIFCELECTSSNSFRSLLSSEPIDETFIAISIHLELSSGSLIF